MSFNADADAFGIRESVLLVEVFSDKRLNLIRKKQKSKRNNNNKKKNTYINVHRYEIKI